MPDFATLKPVATSNAMPDFATLKPVSSQPVASPEATGNPSFSASANEPVLSGIGKLIGNIPSSGLSFIKSAVTSLNPVPIVKNFGDYIKGFQEYSNQVGNPSDAALNVIKEFPNTIYSALVPKATQQVISGDYQGAKQTITNDPVGQILPYILLGKAAAEKAGYGQQFDNAISSTAKPVTAPVGALVSKVSGLAGKATSQVLGAATGVGASSIQEAARHSDAFTQAMRGNINPDDVVQTAQDAVENITNARRSEYLSQLQKIGEQKGSLDISPVVTELQSQLKNFGLSNLDGTPKLTADGSLDFSRSSIANNGSARADIQGVYDTIKEWGSQSGDRTPVGLDTLKKQLGDFYSQSNNGRAFVQGVKSSVSNILTNQIEGYSKMTKGYADASQLLNDIKSATGVGGNAKVDTVFTKLTTAMKADKELRLQILDQMQAQGAQPDLMAKIAGTNMQSFVPKGILGKGVDAYAILTHFFNPAVIPALLSTSPRIVGEFVRGLGIGADKASTVLNAINNIPNRLGPVLTKNVEDIKPSLGMSVQDVTKSLHPEDQAIMQRVVDHFDNGGNIADLPNSDFLLLEKLAPRIGVSLDSPFRTIVNKLDDILAGKKASLQSTAQTGRPFNGENNVANKKPTSKK